MCFTTAASLLLGSASLALAAPTAATSLNLTLDQQLELATTQVQRIEILAEAGGNQSFVFNFNDPPTPAVAENTTNGSVIEAVGGTFPALIGLDSALVKFSLGPCGLIVPHLHPRADEFIVVTTGSLFTQFLTESGSTVITNNLTTLESTIFPKGSFHFEMNPTCEDTVFFGSFNSNDPGTTLVANSFLSLDETVALTALGGMVDSKDFLTVEQALPAGPVTAVSQCMAACGIKPSRKRSLVEIAAEKARK